MFWRSVIALLVGLASLAPRENFAEAAFPACQITLAAFLNDEIPKWAEMIRASGYEQQ